MTCYHYGNLHICTNDSVSDWDLSAGQKWCKPGNKVIVYCCNRVVPVETAEYREIVAFGGYVHETEFRCAPEHGCNLHEGYRRTAHLREGWYSYDE